MHDFDCTFESSTASQLLDIFTAAQFLVEFAEQIPVTQHSEQIDRDTQQAVVRLSWTFPTNKAPWPFSKYLPTSVELNWKTTWDISEREAPSGTFEAHSEDPYISVKGSTMITPAESSNATRWQVSGTISARRKGPIPAKVVASSLESLFIAVLTDQRKVAERWLDIRANETPTGQQRPDR